MKIELHLLQNFAPSNLNRDDTGAPKDCELGGHRRARISSQCQKRAVRAAFELSKLVEPEAMGVRTKRLAMKVAEELAAKHAYERERALAVAMGALEGVGLGRNKKGDGDDAWKTEYLLFVPKRVVGELVEVLHDNRAALEAAVQAPSSNMPEGPVEGAEKGAEEAPKKAPKKDRKREKKEAQSAYPKEVRDAVEALLEEARKTVDVALFGRMIADKADWNVDAACQVAHAISTNRVKMDFDFFTALDDFKPDDNAGSDMMGTVQFNSSCFYRYAVLDVTALRENLGGGSELVARAVDAFVRGFVTAIPTGKQNGTAAHNFPSYAMAVVREGGTSVSLANAFLKPARPRGDDVDLVDDSIKKLEDYAHRLRDVVGDAHRFSWADRDLLDGEAYPTRISGLHDFYAEVSRRALGAPA